MKPRKLNGPAFMRRIESLRWYRWGRDPERRMVRTPKKGE
jgi:hypothetical protein